MREWQEVKAAGTASAKELLDKRGDFFELRALFDAWLAANEGQKDDSLVATSAATTALANEFQRRNLPEASEAIRIHARQEGPIPAGRWMVARLLGLAAADRLIKGFAKNERRSIDMHGLDSYGAWEAFREALNDGLHSDEAGRDGFWNECERFVEEVRTAPERRALLSEKASVEAAIRAYADAPKLKDAWDEPPHWQVLLHDTFLFKVACKLDPERYISLLARLPHPAFINQCIEDGVADLAFLICAAPPAFDVTGTYLVSGAVIITLLRACAARFRRLAWNGHEAPELVAEGEEASLESAGNESRSFLEPVLDSLFARKDSFELGWAWLEHLIFEGEHRGYWRCDRGRGPGRCLDPLRMLIFGLAAKMELRSDYMAWISAREDLWQIDRIGAVLAVGAAKLPADAMQRGNLFSEILLKIAPSYAGAMGSIQRSDCVIGRIGAVHLNAASMPDRLIFELWDKLRPVRERSWRAESGVRNGAAELLVSSAVCAVECAEGAPKRELWLSVRSILESAMQTEYYTAGMNFWPMAVKRLCRSIKAITTDDPSIDLDDMAELLRPYIGQRELLFEIVFILLELGVATTAMAALAQHGVTLPLLAKRFLQINTLRIEAGHFSRIWVRQVEMLAEQDRLGSAPCWIQA